jgi:altronate dehydratase
MTPVTDVALIVLSAGDDVGVCVSGAAAGDRALAGGARWQIVEDIPPGHKVALHDIAAGEAVHKYGESIGNATQAVRRGAHVHVHNLSSARGRAL